MGKKARKMGGGGDKVCKEMTVFARKKSRLWYLDPLSGSFFA